MGLIKNKMIKDVAADKIIETNTKKFITGSLLQLINKFSYSDGVLKYDGSAIGMPQLYEAQTTIRLNASESQFITLPVGFNKYDIRTVYFDANAIVNVTIYDKAVNGFVVYDSLSEKSCYDVVNVPCEDKSGNKNLNVKIQNTANVPTTVTLSIKVTSLV